MSSANAVVVQSLINSLDHDEGREVFREAMENQRSECMTNRDFRSAKRISRILRRDRLFQAAYSHFMSSGAQAFVASRGEVSVAELGDGEFLKWLLEWFSDGGWQIIIDFIKQLIPLFGGLIALMVSFAILFLLM